LDQLRDQEEEEEEEEEEEKKNIRIIFRYETTR